MTDFSQLPEWTCHKVVRAAKILKVLHADGAAAVVIEMAGDQASWPTKTLLPEDLPADIFARGEPAAGDYLVVYEDGYVSWSPAKAFEEGYVPGRLEFCKGDDGGFLARVGG